jgi:hypothetical protein
MNELYTSSWFSCSVGFRINEAMCYLSYDAPYLFPEGGRPGRPTQAVRHTCAGNLGIVKILRYLRSDMYTASVTNSKVAYITRASKRNLARRNKNALGPP